MYDIVIISGHCLVGNENYQSKYKNKKIPPVCREGRFSNIYDRIRQGRWHQAAADNISPYAPFNDHRIKCPAISAFFSAISPYLCR